MAKPPIAISTPSTPIHTTEMHTTGEPTRIITSGFPPLPGSTLLAKRTYAQKHLDHLRRRLMHEPRGHSAMYGALLVRETELTVSGEADAGVLFMHNEGWSTMCGHATLALGRFLVDDDAEGSEVYAKPTFTATGETGQLTTQVRLHCPCGPVAITVPVLASSSNGDLRSNPSRDSSFIIPGCFPSGTSISIPILPEHRWAELPPTSSNVAVDFLYGGAFYAVVSPSLLGFPSKPLSQTPIETLSRAAAGLKAAITTNPAHGRYFTHPDAAELGFLYGVIVTAPSAGDSPAVDGPTKDSTTDGTTDAPTTDAALGNGIAAAETGLCFFGDGQVDRSPTGSGVAARRALMHVTGKLKAGERFAFNSPLSERNGGKGAFVASVVGEEDGVGNEVGVKRVSVRVEGRAWYTGSATFVVEEGDGIGGEGFLM